MKRRVLVWLTILAIVATALLAALLPALAPPEKVGPAAAAAVRALGEPDTAQPQDGGSK